MCKWIEEDWEFVVVVSGEAVQCRILPKDHAHIVYAL